MYIDKAGKTDFQLDECKGVIRIHRQCVKEVRIKKLCRGFTAETSSGSDILNLNTLAEESVKGNVGEICLPDCSTL